MFGPTFVFNISYARLYYTTNLTAVKVRLSGKYLHTRYQCSGIFPLDWILEVSLVSPNRRQPILWHGVNGGMQYNIEANYEWGKENVDNRHTVLRSYLPVVGRGKQKEFETVNRLTLLPKVIWRMPKELNEGQKLKVVMTNWHPSTTMKMMKYHTDLGRKEEIISAPLHSIQLFLDKLLTPSQLARTFKLKDRDR